MNIIAQAMADGILERAREDERLAARLVDDDIHYGHLNPSGSYWQASYFNDSTIEYLHACAIVDDLEREE